MSEINQIVEQVKQATDFQINRKILREKMQTDLHFAYNGGLFNADPAQYAFVCLWQGDPDALFLEDTYGNPIKINKDEFIKLYTEQYQTVMNTWHQEYGKLRQIRKV